MTGGRVTGSRVTGGRVTGGRGTGAFWPGLGGDALSLTEVAPVVARRGVSFTALDPGYGRRGDWALDTLARELAETGADVYAGHSWGAAVAVEAAALIPPQALVLLDGGYLGPSELAGADADADPAPERASAALRAEHEALRWASVDEYLAWVRPQLPRWNHDVEAMVLSGLREEDGQVLPPFDADELHRILRDYDGYDAPVALGRLAPGLPVLLVVADDPPELEEPRERLLARFCKLVPRAEVRRVSCGHDIVLGLGPALGELIGDWLGL